MSATAGFLQALYALLPTYGYAVLGAASFAGAVGAPLPVTFLLLAAGALASEGVLQLVPAFAAVLAAAVAGDCMGYAIGAYAGRPLLVGAGPRAGLTGERLAAAERAFAKWGGGAVWITRWLLTAVAPAVNVLAGANRYRFPGFLLFDALGEALWAGGYLGLGWAFGDVWSELEDLVGSVTGLAAAVAAVVILALVSWRVLRRSAPSERPSMAPA
ncbi:MAG: VTT domain-containing protein [Chloroflexi bacterium]|nr:VTT domain-containing protein [Chloroflexota bacterium]